jgi:hypothetical protein
MSPRSLPAIFTFFATAAFGAEAPADFAGIKWGASRQEARAALTQRGAKPLPKESDANRLAMDGGSFAGRPAAGWRLTFTDGQMTRAGVRLQTRPKEAEKLFREMKSELNEKYGMANDSQVAHRKAPHFVYGLGWRDSGTTPPALHAEWVVTSGVKPRTVEIHLWVNNGLVHLAYVNQTMIKAAAPAGGKSDDL